MIKKLFVAAAVALPLSAMAVTPLWLRDVKISPDGKTIAFQYKSDIWTVPVNGGKATRLTDMADSYEASPVWSPDSKEIAFASDLHGNFDVFVIPVGGGKATRLTFNSAAETPEAFTPDGKNIYFSASIQDPARSAMFPMSALSELYSVPVKGGATRQVLGTPALRLNFTGKDNSFLYQDRKGFEDEWRKHHTSSVTRDIWLYDAANGKHTNLTARGGEDRDPVALGDKIYFLSERDGGAMNVYVAPASNLSNPVAVTSFKGHPVGFLSASDNGTLCYAWDGEIYTQKPDGKPVKVAISVPENNDTPVQKLSVRSGARSPKLSNDGKYVAFAHRGDIFVTSVEYNTTKQITATPEAESAPVWSKDGKTLYYVSERDGQPNIWQATLKYDTDPDFPNATVIEEKPVFKYDGKYRSYPDVSPDGKTLSFIADREKLYLMDIKSGKVRELHDGRYTHSRTGFGYVWSPDSKWIATEIDQRKHSPYGDIGLINVADGSVLNLTNSGYFAENPKFVLDGNAILYSTDKYGMRNHASWGSLQDAMLVFLNREAYDKFKLNEEDLKIFKDQEKKAKEDAEKKDGDKKDKKDKDKKSDKDAEASKNIVVEPEGLDMRTVRLTPMSVDLGDILMSPDGETLYYLMSAPDGTQLWKLNKRKDEHRMVTKVSGGYGFDITPDGKTALLAGSQLRKFDPKSEKLTPITYSSDMTVDPVAEREYMFDYVAREEGERFYNKSMHGVNWPELTKHYRKFLPYIDNNYDFAEMLSELLGELNASHTGGRYYGNRNSQADRTATLGLLYDLKYTGDGLKVDEVIADGPFDKASSKLKPGMIVKAVNGKEIKAGQETAQIFNDIAGKKTMITILDPNTGKTFDEVARPISKGTESDLLYRRWVRNRAADVDRWSNGRLGYVHIESMSDGSFRPLYSDVLGKYNDRDGIVIDIRGNGGGRMHEDIEIMFSGEKYLTQEFRGRDLCDMPSRRWNKPSIMVMSEACYSNAHGTPWVYKHMKLGKLVGAQVPGTMTSVNWVTLQDPSLVFGIPAIGYRTAEGTYLENSDLDPDIPVLNEPEVIVTGEDQQLHRAVDELLKEIDAQKGASKK